MKTRERFIWVASLLIMAGITVSHASLVAQWKFDETEGSTILKDSVGTADGAVGEGVAFVPSMAGFGNAGDFSSTTNYITLGTPDVLDLGTGDFTMTGWFKAPAISSGDSAYHMIFENGKGNQGGVNLWLGPGNRGWAGKFGLDIKGSGVNGNITVRSDNRLDNDQWHWFAAHVSSGVAILYIDGKLQVESQIYGEGTTATAPGNYIAKFGNVYDGLIDDFRIYDKALTGTVDENNILINGDLFNIWQIPEPGTLLLLAGGFVAFVRKQK